MNVRPPKAYSRKAPEDPISAALEQEILAEKASTYSRLMQRLERALADLEAFDAGETPARGEERPQSLPRTRSGGAPGKVPGKQASDIDERAALVARAGEALWHVVVQRELMRLPGTERFLKEMKVPPELRLRMGVMRRR